MIVRFSVIIPTYNRRVLLRQALASVWAQTYANYEVIVVDDGSTDGTWDDLVAQGSRVRSVRQENAGPGAARNLGVQHAAGEYLAFLDSDDLWFPWTLATYARCLSENQNASLICGRGIFFDSGPPSNSCSGPVECQFHSCLFNPLGGQEFAFPTPAVAFQRSAFLDLGGFRNLFIAEDMDLWLRSGCLSGCIRVTSPVLCAERRHVTRTTSDLARTLEGLSFVLDEELAGIYPGGERFKRVREDRIARAFRSVSIACVRHQRWTDAWNLYCKTLRMNYRLKRWRYLAGFPLMVATRFVRRLRFATTLAKSPQGERHALSWPDGGPG